MTKFRSNERVLLVDDDALARGVGATILRQFGYRVTETDSGYGALKILSEHPLDFDLLLLDHTMPDLDGSDVLRQLRITGCEIPAIICVGIGESRPGRRWAPPGASAIIDKPFRLPELLPALRNALEGAELDLG